MRPGVLLGSTGGRGKVRGVTADGTPNVQVKEMREGERERETEILCNIVKECLNYN